RARGVRADGRPGRRDAPAPRRRPARPPRRRAGAAQRLRGPALDRPDPARAAAGRAGPRHAPGRRPAAAPGRLDLGTTARRRGEVDPAVARELIAGALESGLPLSRALAAGAAALPGGTDAEAMRAVASALAAGVPARLAVDALPAELDALGRSAVLAEETGAD